MDIVDFETVTSQGVQGVQRTQDRLAEMQQQWIELYQSGQLTGAPMDDRQMLEAAYYSQYTPKEWQALEQTRQSEELEQVDTFWKQKGAESRQMILESVKTSPPELSPEQTLAKLEEAEENKHAHHAQPVNLGEIIHAIGYDIQHWDELPQKTTGEKIDACFFSKQRIGVVLGLALVFTLSISIVVVCTL